MEWFQGPSSEFKTSLMLLIQNFLLNRISSLDLSTPTGYPQYSAPISTPTKESTTTPPAAPTPAFKPPEPTETPKPIFNWWESSETIPKRSLSTHIERPTSTTAIAENDRDHLQEKQTKAIQQVLEDMKLANEEQEKKLQQQNKKKRKEKRKNLKP
jgi:hypothetical protein